MDLSALRKRSISLTIGGTEFKIGKVSAADYFALLEFASEPDADVERSQSGIRFYSHLLSKCILHDNGLALDSDKGRAELPQVLTWEELQTLGRAAMEFNGFGESKKN